MTGIPQNWQGQGGGQVSTSAHQARRKKKTIYLPVSGAIYTK
jgi:hypothetical protein